MALGAKVRAFARDCRPPLRLEIRSPLQSATVASHYGDVTKTHSNLLSSCMSLGIAIATGGAVSLVAIGCGGSAPTPAAPTDAKPAAADAPAATGAATPAADAPPADKHSVAEAAPHVDPNEKDGAIELAALVDKTKKPAFPKQTVGDHDCLKELAFTGHHQADFATLVGKCGTPTGMVEYTKPAEGRLHAKHDKRDEFKLKVQKGMCYRYFAVADDGIKDIDIIVLKKGALLAMDKTEQAVAVIDTEKLWCVDEDMELEFNIEVDGRGAGGYTFGVWTRPKGK